MKKLQVSWEENGNYFIDFLEINKDCTPDQANQLIEMGIAKIIEDKKE